jgi:hypothetical protein
MADMYSKDSILGKLKEKTNAKGFKLDWDRTKMSPETKGTEDLLDAIAEAFYEILSNKEDSPATLKCSEIKIGPAGAQNAIAYKDGQCKSEMSVDSSFWSFIEAFFAIATGPPIPEPGYGAPSMFKTALQAALSAAKPNSITFKIIDGTDKVKVST